MKQATVAKLALSVAVVAGGAGFLVYSSTSHAQHYELVDVLLTKGFEPFKGKQIKVAGYVQPGTIATATVNQETRRTFVLQKAGKKIRVFVTGPVPDTFRDSAETLATGSLVEATDLQQVADDICKNAKESDRGDCPVRTDAEQTMVVQATELSAKCPTKYKGADSNKLGTTRYELPQ